MVEMDNEYRMLSNRVQVAAREHTCDVYSCRNRAIMPGEKYVRYAYVDLNDGSFHVIKQHWAHYDEDSI